MKVLIIKKRNLINSLVFIFLIVFCLYTVYLYSNKTQSFETLYPIDVSQNSEYDLNGNGAKDTLEIVKGQNKIDIKIKSSNQDYFLSKEVPDKILFNNTITLKPNIFIHDISRNNLPEIILLGYKNNKPINYIFQWNKDKFSLIYQSTKNIFGILDSKNTKTPQCYSISSPNIDTLNSFMVINNSILDTTAENQTVPTINPVNSFINIIELPYELDDLPDIFSPSISRDELSLLWNLDKENNSYKFQNGFFYDYEWNDNSEITAVKWRLSFIQNKIKDPNNNPKEMILLVDLSKSDSTYKISSIEKTN